MPSGWYNKGVYDLSTGGLDLDGSTVKAMLLNQSHSFNRDHNFVSDISANEISAVGYARQTLVSKAVTEDDTNDAAYWDAADPVFGPLASGQTIEYLALYRDTGVDATSPLIACWQLVATATDGGTFTFTVSASGLTKIWSAT